MSRIRTILGSLLLLGALAACGGTPATTTPSSSNGVPEAMTPVPMEMGTAYPAPMDSAPEQPSAYPGETQSLSEAMPSAYPGATVTP